MTTMIVEVYEALRAINVPDDKATAAARALTTDMTSEVAALRKDMAAEFAAVRGDTAALRKEIAAEFATVRKETTAEFVLVRKDIETLRTDIAVLRWMGATLIALVSAVAIKTFVT